MCRLPGFDHVEPHLHPRQTPITLFTGAPHEFAAADDEALFITITLTARKNLPFAMTLFGAFCVESNKHLQQPRRQANSSRNSSEDKNPKW